MNECSPISLQFDCAALDRFMPMHVVLDTKWRVRHIGPTLKKIGMGDRNIGAYFLDVFDVLHPRRFNQSSEKLIESDGKMKARLKEGASGKLKGFAQVLPNNQGILVNFSLGAGMVQAIDREGLLARDFAPTDASIDLIYLIEVQRALLAEARLTAQKMHRDRKNALVKADTDVLTGLTNRRGMDAFVARIMARKTFVPFAYLMIDLDFFKAVNDTMGHMAGDAVLTRVADRLTGLTRRGDLVARTGGDEFNIILPDFTDAIAAKNLCERVIAELKRPIDIGDKECAIGASIGATIVNEKSDFDATVKAVDKALYESKENGRGRVTMV
jgi:diguanylate cyclase (GGDEF)-like protein